VTTLRRPPREELLHHLKEAEFLISERSGEIDAEMIAVASRLRLIQRLGSLTHDIDLETARAIGVTVTAWPVRGAIMVAEHMILQMLSLAKRLNEAVAVANEAGAWDQPSRRTDENLCHHNWSGRRGAGQIYAHTVVFSALAKSVKLARRLRGFAPARILCHRRRRLPERAEAELGLSYSPMLDRVVAEVISCAIYCLTSRKLTRSSTLPSWRL
jgi:phosphoglycerate dehydrogenase-like enzyme